MRKSVISQLQSVGEGALGRLAQSPATRSAVHGAIQVKERGERFYRSLESIERRLGAIEERLTALEHEKAAPRRRATAGAERPSKATAGAERDAKASS